MDRGVVIYEFRDKDITSKRMVQDRLVVSSVDPLDLVNKLSASAMSRVHGPFPVEAGCVLYAESGGTLNKKYALRMPPKTHELKYSYEVSGRRHNEGLFDRLGILNGNELKLKFNIYIPPIIAFVHAMENRVRSVSLYLTSSDDIALTNDTVLKKFPFGNTHSGCDVCIGSANRSISSHIQLYSWVESFICGSEFNEDIRSNTGGSWLTKDIATSMIESFCTKRGFTVGDLNNYGEPGSTARSEIVEFKKYMATQGTILAALARGELGNYDDVLVSTGTLEEEFYSFIS